MRKNEAGQVVAFQAVSSTDGSAVTTGSPTVYITIDGGTQATGTNTAIHEGQGSWSYVPTQAETNGDHVVFTFVMTGVINQTVNVYPVVVNDYKADVSGLSTFNPATDTVANVTTVGTCTTNTDMRGTDGANTVAPDNASITAILADTNELQTNQGNWLTATGFSTFNPATDTVANVTTVGTCTTNTDMRGTDGANTVAPDNASISAILADTNELQLNQGDWATATGFNTVAPDNASITAILADTDELQTKLIPMLVLDGSVYQYTTNALENAPAGGGGGGDATLANQQTIITTLAGIEGSGFDSSTDSLAAISEGSSGQSTSAPRAW